MADTTPSTVNSTGYTIFFAAIVGLVCATLVSVAAVMLQPMQDANARLYMEKNVLIAADLVESGQSLSIEQVDQLFDAHVVTRLIDLETGQVLDVDPATARQFDQRSARNDPAMSEVAPANEAGVRRLPERAPVYFIQRDGAVSQVVIPVDGLGMWGTVYGFMSLAADGKTVEGVTFYEHKETPGLGGEIANPEWQAVWEGRVAYDETGDVELRIIKGQAGPPSEDPHEIDGLAGSTVTGDAVTRFVQFWLGERGFKPFLERLSEGDLT